MGIIPPSVLPAGLPTGARRVLMLAVMAVVAGCSPKNLAIDLVADALSGGGGVYTSDPDPELIREALPFALKTYEGLLAASPGNLDLLLTAAQGFAAYAYILDDEAEQFADSDPLRSKAQRLRAKNFYLRGRDYALQGLEISHPGFGAALRSPESAAALAGTTLEDTDFLYWAGATWAGALYADKQDFKLLAELRFAGQMVQRVNELDNSYGGGSAHEFLITYEGSRPGGSAKAARAHYAEAIARSGDTRANPYLALAEGVAVSEQNLAEFRDLLAAALAVDLDADPSQRVINTLIQQRARWLLTRIPELFFEASDGENNS